MQTAPLFGLQLGSFATKCNDTQACSRVLSSLLPDQGNQITELQDRNRHIQGTSAQTRGTRQARHVKLPTRCASLSYPAV
jgi:hypothetical protein